VRERLFYALAALAARRSGAVLVVATVLTLLALILASRLEIKTSFKDTLGPDDPVAQQQTYLEQNFPGVNTVMVVIEGAEPERLVEVARALEAGFLERPDQVRSVYLEQPLDFFVSHGLLYQPLDDLRVLDATAAEWEDTFAHVLADPSLPGMTALIERVAEQRAGGAGAAAAISSRVFGRPLVGQGPWGGMGAEMGVQIDASPVRERVRQQVVDTLRELPLPQSNDSAAAFIGTADGALRLIADVLDEGERLAPGDFEDRMRALRETDYRALMGAAGERYRISPDGGMLLMEVSGANDLGKIEAALPFIDTLKEIIADTVRGAPDVEVTLTGFPVMIQEENSALIDNFALVTVLGFIGVLAVFVIGFERVGLPSLAGVPLLMGTAWTFGLQTLVYGDITLFSLAFPVLLLGVGVDFAIHLLSGYAERRREGLDPEAALRGTYDRIGAGLLTGGITTAAAFLVLMASSYYGLRTMGFTAGVGVMMALVAMCTVLPALVVRFDARASKREELLPDVPFVFLGRLAGTIQRLRYPALALFLGLTVTLAYHATSVELDTNYMNILPQELPSLQSQDAILERFGLSNDTVTLLAEDLEDAERIRAGAEGLSTVAEVFSASALIPADQDAKRPLIEALGARLERLTPDTPPPEHPYDAAEIRALEDRFALVKGSLLEYSLLSSALYGPDVQAGVGALRDLINRVDRRLAPASAHRLRYLDGLLAGAIDREVDALREMTSNTAIAEADLPPAILERLRGEDGAWIVMVRANGNVWNDHFRLTFLDELEGLGAPIVGMVPSIHHMMRTLLREIPRMTGLIFAVVVILVMVDLKSFRGMMLALTPLVVGLIWTLGVMGLFGVPFNVISVIAVPLIVGIGIDDGVHLYHRIRKERALAPAMTHSGKAIILTSLTTSIGFGSLMLSIHPGFFSLGLVTTLGILSCLVVSLFLLPALVAIFDPATLEDAP